MTALPSNTLKTNLDAGTDDPSQARAQLATMSDAVNSIISYLSGLFGGDGTQATAKSTLGVAELADSSAGEGLEIVSGAARVKLDGATLARSTSGLKVASKGIGLTQMADGTQGSMLYYGAAGVIAALAAGTSGQFLKTQGSGANPTWADVPAKGLNGIQVFASAGTTTWNRLSGTTNVIVICIGGGGGAGADGDVGMNGGAGGGASLKVIDVSAIASVSVTVGGGGVGRAGGANQSGGNGGTTSFGSHCSATGGQGGNNNTSETAVAGSGIGGHVNATGGDGSGGAAAIFSGSSGIGTGKTYGGGAAGVSNSAGAAGAIIVIEFK